MPFTNMEHVSVAARHVPAHFDGDDKSADSRSPGAFGAFQDELHGDRMLIWKVGADANSLKPVLPEALTNPGPLGDRSIGRPDAPVTIVEYGSLTCGHCADFETKTMPELTRKYIDSGQVRFIFREFPRNAVDYVAGAVAQSLPEDKYFDFVETTMKRQDELLKSPKDTIISIAAQFGVSEKQVIELAGNKELMGQLAERGQKALGQLGLEGTPTFFINGKKITGFQALKEIEEQMRPYLQK